MKSEKAALFSDTDEAVIRRHAGDQTEDDEEIYMALNTQLFKEHEPTSGA